MAVKNYGIHDKWTNINKVNDIEIQSVDGVIENIKVNGEPAGGGGGSSDFSTAEVSFNNTSQSNSYSIGIICLDVNNISYSYIEIPPEGATKVIPLYKGRTVIPLMVENVDMNTPPTSSDGLAIDEDFQYLTITGNGTFTAKGKTVS